MPPTKTQTTSNEDATASSPRPVPTGVESACRNPAHISWTSVAVKYPLLTRDATTAPLSAPSRSALVSSFRSSVANRAWLCCAATPTTTRTTAVTPRTIRHARLIRAGETEPLIPRTKICTQAATVVTNHPAMLAARICTGSTDHRKSDSRSSQNHMTTPKAVIAMAGADAGCRHSRQTLYSRTGRKQSRKTMRTTCMTCHAEGPITPVRRPGTGSTARELRAPPAYGG